MSNDGSTLGAAPGGVRLDTLLANLPGMAYRCTNERDWPMEFASPGCLSLTGYEPEVLLGDGEPSYGSLIHQDDREHVWEAVQQAIAAHSPFELEYRIRRADGSERWVWERGCYLEGPRVLEGFITDITERREAELRARRLFSDSPLPSYLWRHLDGQLRLVDFNEAALQVTAGRIRELAGSTAADFFINAPEIPPILERALETHEPLRLEHRYRYRSTTAEHDLVVNARFLPPDALLVVTEDITEQRSLAAKLALAQRLEAIGRLAGGVAHDFNNLLTAIGGYAEVLLESVDSETAREDLQEIGRAVEQATRLTNQLLAFGRQQVLRPQQIDLNEIVASTERMLRRLIGEDIALTCARAADLYRVHADAGQLEQVLLNLAINARDALPKGGNLQIETRNVELDKDHVATLPAGSYVLLLVRDDGLGMSEETRNRAFEPFFTTKLEGKGTGLGLATVYGIVEQSGGAVTIESRPEAGTSVRVYLPRSTETPQQTVAPPSPLAPVPFEQPRSILVVEDDRSVRTLVTRVLSDEGFSVRSAHDGTEALRAAQEHGPFDLLLTDLVMPGLGGLELARTLAQDGPELRALFMSGYAGGKTSERGLLGPDMPFLAKPFTRSTLLAQVHEALSARPIATTLIGS